MSNKNGQYHHQIDPPWRGIVLPLVEEILCKAPKGAAHRHHRADPLLLRGADTPTQASGEGGVHTRRGGPFTSRMPVTFLFVSLY